jgi:hypothetical protein
MKVKLNNSIGEQGRAVRRFLPLCALPLFVVLAWSGYNQNAGAAPGTKTGAADASPAGTYNLVTADGKNVPCTVQHDGHSMTIKSGAFVINADGTCISKMTLAGRDVPIEVKATYKREGSRLTMKWEGAGMTIGTVKGDTFTMNNEGMVLVYRK